MTYEEFCIERETDPESYDPGPPDDEPTLYAARPTHHSTQWQFRRFHDAFVGDARPPWIITGLVIGDSGTLLSAQPHSLKSLSCLYACMEAPATGKVFGHFDAAKVKTTLFIETEDPEWLVNARIRGFAAGLGLKNGDDIPGFNYVCPGPFDLVAFESQVSRHLDKYRPDFAVLSTLQNLLEGRNWSRPEEMQPVNAAIIRLCRAYCPLVVVTHSPWDKKQKRAAGTVTQTANYMITGHYEKIVNPQSNDTYAHVVIDSKAGEEESDFTLKLVTEGPKNNPQSVRKIFYEGRGWPKGMAKARVLWEIERDPTAAPKDIADRAGCTIRYVQKLMKEGV
jgi:hypothetical protein